MNKSGKNKWYAYLMLVCILLVGCGESTAKVPSSSTAESDTISTENDNIEKETLTEIDTEVASDNTQEDTTEIIDSISTEIVTEEEVSSESTEVDHTEKVDNISSENSTGDKNGKPEKESEEIKESESEYDEERAEQDETETQLPVIDEGTRLAQEIVDQIISPSMSDVEKALAINDWIIYNVSYDYENYYAGTIPSSSCYVEGVITTGLAVCQGYALTFSALAENAGLDVRYVVGEANNGSVTDGHAWNQVKIDGKWYNVDTTWSDDFSPDVYREKLIEFDGLEYFLISDETLEASHIWDKDVHMQCPDAYGGEKFAIALAKGNEYRNRNAHATNTEELKEAVTVMKTEGVELSDRMIWIPLEEKSTTGFPPIEVAEMLSKSGISAEAEQWLFREDMVALRLREAENWEHATSKAQFLEKAQKYKDEELEEVYFTVYGFMESDSIEAELVKLLEECDWSVEIIWTSVTASSSIIIRFQEVDRLHHVTDDINGVLERYLGGELDTVTIHYLDEEVGNIKDERELNARVMKYLAEIECPFIFKGCSNILNVTYNMQFEEGEGVVAYIVDEEDIEGLSDIVAQANGGKISLVMDEAIDDRRIHDIMEEYGYKRSICSAGYGVCNCEFPYRE